MAEWRTRGYVADSDDEEDSQTAVQPDFLIPHAANPHHNDNDIDRLSQPSKDVSSQTSRQVENIYGETCQKEISSKKAKEKTTGNVLGGVRLEINEISSQEVENHQASVIGATLVQDFEDIDELQEDHYKTSPIIQLRDETLQKDQCPASPAPAATLYQSQTCLVPTSIQISHGHPAPHKPRLADQIPSSQVPSTSQENDETHILGSPQILTHSPPVRTTEGSNRASRTLRHRNPIQLHPYAIESEKYRQILMDRGVKPLRMKEAEAESQAASIPGEGSGNARYQSEESQGLAEDISRDNFESQAPAHTQDPAAEPTGNQNDIFVFGDDELPDINTLLANPNQRYHGNGHKRRKLSPPSFRMPPKMSREIHNPSKGPSSPLNDDDDVMFDEPPSPPHSESQTPLKAISVTLPGSRLPKKSSMPTLPTPLASSEPIDPHVFEVSEEEASDNLSRIDSQSVTSIDESGTDENIPAHHRSRHLRGVQRKIRGVLPASWLKLDLKSKSKGSEAIQREDRGALTPKNINQRGVARPVTVGARNDSDSPKGQKHAIVLSDAEDSSSNCSNVQRQSVNGRNMDLDNANGGFPEERWGEAEQSDQIDAMLPSITRPRHRSRIKKKRQTKTAQFDVYPQSATRAESKVSQNHHFHQSRLTNRFNKGHKRKSISRPPKLSILDTPSLKSLPGKRVLPFLKIAARTTRSRIDKGRHSPGHKYLRLASQRDNEDVHQTLCKWRDGTINPTLDDRPRANPYRRPLHPRSTNDVRSLEQNESKQSPTRTSNLISSNDVKPQAILSRVRNFHSSMKHLRERQSKRNSESGLTPHPHLSEEQPKKRGQLVSSIRAKQILRPAMLEASGLSAADKSHARSVFNRTLSTINHFDDESGLPNVLRLFDAEKQQLPAMVPQGTDKATTVSSYKEPITNVKKPKVLRKIKRHPRRLDVSTSWSRPSSVPLGDKDLPDRPIFLDAVGSSSTEVLSRLESFSTQFSETFDIIPLPTGTSFHGSTFIGSGLFSRSLTLKDGSLLDSPRGHALIQFNGQSYRWGPWNDAVSSELGETVAWIRDAIQARPVHDQVYVAEETYYQVFLVLKTVIVYFSDHLSFHDPIDRLSCVQRCQMLILGLSASVDNRYMTGASIDSVSSNHSILAILMHFNMMITVFANQIRQISQHALVPTKLQDELEKIVHQLAQKNVDRAITDGSRDFERYVSKTRSTNATEYLIKDEYSPIEILVVTRHILRNAGNTVKSSMLQRIDVATGVSAKIFDVCLAELSWKRVFTVLPFFEFEANGILETGRRFREPFDDWAIIKRLVSPAFEASLTKGHGQTLSLNPYCRSLLRRCLHLINGWGWRNCESIIGTLFDFFARNDLGHLKNEESHGSPNFLEQLAQGPSLAALPEDRCFHILLKIIGSGIQHMRQNHPEKKVRDVVWRLMPNHGRSYPKEEAVHQVHLDALRNHHDLLCTLYWASPPSCRPRLTIVRNLVNLESSHREACHINIRAWLNLVRFQLSTDEPTNNLDAFRDWFDDLLSQSLRQHSLARTEVEDQVGSVQQAGGLGVSHELLESTIARNQQQVEAVLSDALVSLRLAVEVTSDQQAAARLMTITLAKVFQLFDVRRPQATKVVTQALDVLEVFAKKSAWPSTQDETDDSQDYGDWPIFEDEVAPAVKTKDTSALCFQGFREPLRRLLSNCFGSDAIPNDSLLMQLVSVWVAVADVLVRGGERSWNDYVDRFGNDSWSSLRGTEHTRKYTPYYLISLIKVDHRIYAGHTDYFLTSWIGSLVERESLLKFQNQFTEALLNMDCRNAMLANLPFCTSGSTGRFEISATDFSERRLSLISSVLSNMRLSLEEAVSDSSRDVALLRQGYHSLLKHMMGTMKHNYQELGHGSHIRGSYVEFVHHVVELLQQHTSTICPVDRYFTDNGAFPLPATDPTYVVGQLKNYALRLGDTGTLKQLTVFLQSVSERAAVDGQQDYLVSQLHIAMSDASEDCQSKKPTLRSFLVKAVVPAYLGLAYAPIGRDCGWILVLPYLRALQRIFTELMLDLDGANASSVDGVISIINAYLDSMYQTLKSFLSSSMTLVEAGILKLMSACYSTLTAALPTLDYVVRLSAKPRRASCTMTLIKNFGIYISDRLDDHDVSLDSEFDDKEENQTYMDTRRFATQELRNSLTKDWMYVRHEDQYYFTRGTSRREVVVDIGLYEEEKANLIEVLEDFFDCLGAMPALGDDDNGEEHSLWRKSRVAGLQELVF